MANQSLFSELRERKVVQVAAIYVAIAWGVTEAVVTIVEQLFLPQWVSTLAVIFFVVGFPVAVFLAWIFDLTPEGIRRAEISSGRGKASIALSLLLLVAGTTGIFFLIKPALDNSDPDIALGDVAPNSVAVLPFDYATSDPDDSHLGPVLSDELRDQLNRVDGLRLAARSSSIAVVREGADARTNALKLGVAHLLEGNMRRQGGVLLVSVQLIDGASGLTVWSRTFERGRRELLNLQQEIAEAVVRKVLPGTDAVLAEPATRVATANELILLGRHYEQQVQARTVVDAELLQRAIQLYRDATEADPESALAYTRLAGALMDYGDIDSAGALANRALELDPRLAEAHHTYGKYLFGLGRPNMGESLARAVELNPNLPDALADYAHWRWYNVETTGVRELYQRAVSLDRLNVNRHFELAHFLAMNDQTQEALDVVEQMIALFDNVTGYLAIAEILDQVGEVDQAIAWAIKARDAEPDNPLHRFKLAEYFVDIEDFDTARSLVPELGVGLLFKMRRYDDLIDEAEFLMIEDPADIEVRIYLSNAYSANGRFDDAIRVISTSRYIDLVVNGWRSSREWEAYMAVMNAAYGSGEIEEARDMARWWRTVYDHPESSQWFQAVGAACIDAVLSQDDKVYGLFRRMLDGKQLAWRPYLEDAQCFKRFANDPEHLKLINHFDDLRAMLRERLPDTLAQHGVAL